MYAPNLQRYHHSAGGIICLVTEAAPLFLITLQIGPNRTKRWTFPKGHVETDEEPLDAAIREVGEEVGIRDLTFCGTLGRQGYSFRWGREFHYKDVDWFCFATRQKEVELQREEGLLKSEWLCYDQALDRVTQDSLKPFLERAQACLLAYEREGLNGFN